MSLERFTQAQDSRMAGYEAALAELERGRKTGHWIWYVFPQLTGLGRSGTAMRYALRDVGEAVEYLEDPVLRGRLARITTVVARHLAAGMDLESLMGGQLDAMKLVSSLTLFEFAARKLDPAGAMPEVDALRTRAGEILDAAEKQGFPRCAFTLQYAARAGRD